LAAFDDLIVEAARGGTRQRYAQIGRFAAIGQQLVRTLGRRVADFEDGGRRIPPNEDGDVGEEVGHGVAYQGGGGAFDVQALTRQMLLTLGPYFATAAEAQSAQVASLEASELRALQDLRNLVAAGRAAGHDTSDLDTRLLGRRMADLTSRIKARLHDEEEVPLDPPDGARGHLAHPGEPGDDGTPRLRLAPERGGGDGAPPRPRDEA
jgi:hypothetical protein